ncbi:alpha/beta fold hydrolase [Mycobacterium sp. SMC-8]|uniref:alpha/beta fold hydrolase n=1 Tax=Mycobacterium sp. SMC-8 TaxID=2857060 RepID=UPI0021B3748C|nr:alpha/beta hydrolase [Mycobacterium sp. SMC-8]
MPFDRHVLDVDGCPVHFRTWGDSTLPPVVLIHGAGAHTGWWDHIAPLLSCTHHVIALDLSGHGDSGRRTDYSLRTWAREVQTVTAACNPKDKPVLIGHSMGGWVATTVAVWHGAEIGAAIAIDSIPQLHKSSRTYGRTHSRRPQPHPTRAAIAARFKVTPDQQSKLPFVFEHIVANSIRQDSDGWRWKFDPLVYNISDNEFDLIEAGTLQQVLGKIACRIGYVRCERGTVATDTAHRIRSALQHKGFYVELAEAGHHPMLDQPLPLVATLRTLLSMWRDS